MTILNLLSVSNTVGPEGILLTFPAVTSPHDVTVAAIVCGTVFVCVLTISICITMMILGKRGRRKAEENARKMVAATNEEGKCAAQEKKVLYDAAWRTIEHYWKAVPCDYEGKFIANNDQLKEAWEYVRLCWRENMRGEDKSNSDDPANQL